jgi:hypothetical protein
VDQGDRLVIGSQTVPLPSPPDAGRFLAIDPAGERVAVGDPTGLRVVARDGSTVTWSTEAVRGEPAWSPDGRALAYATAPDDAVVGPLRVVTADGAPVTAIPAVITFSPVGFTRDRGATALLGTVPGPDGFDPEAGRVTEVTFRRGRPADPLPTTPVAYAAAAFEAWQAQDLARLSQLARPQVVDLLTARPPRPGETWTGPTCGAAAGSTYCTWSNAETTLTIRVISEDASLGRPGAVTEAAFGPPDQGIALWPLTTAEEAANTQEQVDQGHSPWMLEPAAVADSFARAELGWTEVQVTVVSTNLVRITGAPGQGSVDLTVDQPVRTGPGGIWVVTRAGSSA